jgi:hypothetical protein
MPIKQSNSTVRFMASFWHPNAYYDVIPFILVVLIRFPNLRVTKRCERLLLDKG